MKKEIRPDVTLRDVSTIVEYGDNAKEHPDSQIDKLATSIQKFGWTQPLVVDADGVIILGHGRFRAAKKLGFEKVPVIVRSDLTPVEVRQLRIADNKLNETAWNLDALSIDLAWLQEAGADLSLTGFGADEIDSLMQATVPESLDDLEEQYGEHDDSHFWDKINIKLPPEVMQVYEDLMKRAGGDKPHEKFEAILGAVDISALEEMKNIEQDDDAA